MSSMTTISTIANSHQFNIDTGDHGYSTLNDGPVEIIMVDNFLTYCQIRHAMLCGVRCIITNIHEYTSDDDQEIEKTLTRAELRDIKHARWQFLQKDIIKDTVHYPVVLKTMIEVIERCHDKRDNDTKNMCGMLENAAKVGKTYLMNNHITSHNDMQWDWKSCKLVIQ